MQAARTPLHRRRRSPSAPHLLAALGLALATHPLPGAEFIGSVVDADTGQPLACRVYLRDASGAWLHVEPGAPEASAIPYREQWVPMPGIVDRHTTVSAHPFRARLPPGRYTLEIERGKEYHPLRTSFTLDAPTHRETFRLQRWIDLAARGWYSGETHVHRRLAELPNVMEAEDLHVAFPVTFWTIRSDQPPDLAPSPLRSQGPSPFGPREDRGTAPLRFAPNRVIVPRNTEYEIFNVQGRPHTLGALFILNHQTVFTNLAPPVAPIAARARAEGALLDLDKHSWPWSMMLVPVAGVDLFELANNSVWRAPFGFKQVSVAPAEWMNVEQTAPGELTEWGWLHYGFEVYYALLNCGFRLAPTAGTASGVHPVPLGYSRVYVHLDGDFSLESWLAGLKAGRSFVTTGPMVFARLDGTWPGDTRSFERPGPRPARLEVETASLHPTVSIEVLVNGRVAERIDPMPARWDGRAWQARSERTLTLEDSSWIAVRCVEPQPDGRKRFAHTGPWYRLTQGRPLTPRPEQARWLASQVAAEMERSRSVLTPAARAEFEHALRVYESLLPPSENPSPSAGSPSGPPPR